MHSFEGQEQLPDTRQTRTCEPSSTLAESPELLQVAMDQGIPLSEVYGEPAEPECDSGEIAASLPAAAAALIQSEHPDVKKADVRKDFTSPVLTLLCTHVLTLCGRITPGTASLVKT